MSDAQKITISDNVVINGDLNSKKLFSGVAEITGHNITLEGGATVLLETFLAAISRLSCVKLGKETFFQNVQVPEGNEGTYYFNFLIPENLGVKSISLISYGVKDRSAGSTIKTVKSSKIKIPSSNDGSTTFFYERVYNDPNFVNCKTWTPWRIVVKPDSLSGKDITTMYERVKKETFFSFSVVTENLSRDAIFQTNLSFISFFKENPAPASEISIYNKTRDYIASLAAGNYFGTNSFKRHKISFVGSNSAKSKHIANFFEEVETVQHNDISKFVSNPNYPFPKYQFTTEHGTIPYSFSTPETNKTNPYYVVDMDEYKFARSLRTTISNQNGGAEENEFLGTFAEIMKERGLIENEDRYEDSEEVLRSFLQDKINSSLGETAEKYKEILELVQSGDIVMSKVMEIVREIGGDLLKICTMTTETTDQIFSLIYSFAPTEKISHYFEEFEKEQGADKLGFVPSESVDRTRRSDFPIVLPTYRVYEKNLIVTYPEQNLFCKELLTHIASLAEIMRNNFIESKDTDTFNNVSIIRMKKGEENIGILSSYDNDSHSIISLYLKNPLIMKIVSGCSARHIDSMVVSGQKNSNSHGYGCINFVAVQHLKSKLDVTKSNVNGGNSSTYMWSDRNRDSVFNEIIGMTTAQIESLLFEDADLFNSYGGTNNLLLHKIFEYLSSTGLVLKEDDKDLISQQYYQIMNAPIMKYITNLYDNFSAVRDSSFLVSERSLQKTIDKKLQDEQVDEVKKSSEAFIRILQKGPELMCVSRSVKGQKSNASGQARNDTTKITYCSEDPATTWKQIRKINNVETVQHKYCDGGLVFSFDQMSLGKIMPQNLGPNTSINDYRCPYGYTARQVQILMDLLGPHCSFFVPYNLTKDLDKSNTSIYGIKLPSGYRDQEFIPCKPGSGYPFFAKHASYALNDDKTDAINHREADLVISCKKNWLKYTETFSFLKACFADTTNQDVKLNQDAKLSSEVKFSLLLARKLENNNPRSIYNIMPYATETSTYDISKDTGIGKNIRDNFITNCDSIFIENRKKIVKEVLNQMAELKKTNTRIEDLMFSKTEIVNAYLLRANFESKTTCMSKFEYLCLSASVLFGKQKDTRVFSFGTLVNMDLKNEESIVRNFTGSSKIVFANLSNAPLWGRMDGKKREIYFKTMNPTFSVLTSALYFFTRSLETYYGAGKELAFVSLSGKPKSIANLSNVDVSSMRYLKSAKEIFSSGVDEAEMIFMGNGYSMEKVNDNSSFIDKLKMINQINFSPVSRANLISQIERMYAAQKAKNSKDKLNIKVRSDIVLEACTKNRKILDDMRPLPNANKLTESKTLSAIISRAESYSGKTFNARGIVVDSDKYADEAVENFLSKY